MRICPYCESEISNTAKKCKYCGEWVVEMENPFRKLNKKIESPKENTEKNSSKKTTNSIITNLNKSVIKDNYLKIRGSKTHVFDDDEDEINNNINNKTSNNNVKSIDNKGKKKLSEEVDEYLNTLHQKKTKNGTNNKKLSEEVDEYLNTLHQKKHRTKK